MNETPELGQREHCVQGGPVSSELETRIYQSVSNIFLPIIKPVGPRYRVVVSPLPLSGLRRGGSAIRNEHKIEYAHNLIVTSPDMKADHRYEIPSYKVSCPLS